MPPKKRRRWINLKALDSVITPSGVTDSSGNEPTDPSVDPSGNSPRSFYTHRSVTNATRPASSLHVVYFLDPNDSNTVHMNSMQSALNLMQSRYNEMNFHQYPCLENDWPAPLIANLRDAALLSQNLPDGYTIGDILLFVHEKKGQTPYELTGHALACILAAHEKGSSIDIMYIKDNVLTKRPINGTDTDNNTDNNTDNESPSGLELEDRPDASVSEEVAHEVSTYKNLTFACSCRFVQSIADNILDTIKDHDADPEDTRADWRLLNKLLNIMENNK